MVMRRTWVIGCRQKPCIQNYGRTAANRDMVRRVGYLIYFITSLFIIY